MDTSNVNVERSHTTKKVRGGPANAGTVSQFLGPKLQLARVERKYHVVVRTTEPMKTAERGKLLLELERHLRREWHPQAEVFLEPIGDLNRLRTKLRGIQV